MWLPGQRVLAVGILTVESDTGDNAVRLAEAVGPNGWVVSLDQDPAVTAKAGHAHGTGPDGQLRYETGPIAAGWPDGAPYHSMQSQTRVGRLPRAWLAQCVPGAPIITPITMAHPPGWTGLLRVDVNDNHQPFHPRLTLEQDANGPCLHMTTGLRLHRKPDGYTVH